MSEIIYIRQPTDFEDDTSRVCLLNKALYDLKQFARQFYLFLAKLLKDLDYESIIADQSVFYNKKSNIIVTAHIDDLLIFAENKKNTQILKEQLQKKVEISDLGDISYYLSMEITRKCSDKCLHLTQKKYIKELLIKFNIRGDISVYSPTV